MEILDNDGYRQALERANKLRDQKQTATTNKELAELEAAIEQYDSRPDLPARSTGRPTPDPYDVDEC